MTSPTPDTLRRGVNGRSLIDPQALMRVRHLELRARTVVEGFWAGLHRSPYHGFSVEFTEYRQYAPGDDPRYLDWRVLARSDRHFIKKFEDETNLRCHLLVDQSRSMEFGSTGYTKAQYAATLAATLAYFLDLQGDATGVLTFADTVQEYLPARHRPGHMRSLMRLLEQPAQGRGTNVDKPLRRIAEIVRKRGLIILLSDLLAPIERLEPGLTSLTSSGHEVVVFHLLDPAELSLNFGKASEFEDIESGTTLYIDPASARPEYIRKLNAHCESVAASCRKLGIAYHRFSTDQPLELLLFDYVRGRNQRSRTVRRATSAPRGTGRGGGL